MTDNPVGYDRAAESINQQASVLMKQGIRLMESGDADVLDQAIDCFDRALDLRRQLPIDAVPLFGYGLAACWLNRADAIVRLGDSGRFSDALRSYDEAIVLLNRLPLEADPRFPRRLAMAHQNRGLALQLLGPARATETVAAFEAALAVLNGGDADRIADRQYLLAAAWVNLASVHVSVETESAWTLARDAAMRALSLAKAAEEDDVNSAEVGLKARHLLCQTVARRLIATADDVTVSDHVHQATDLADDGLGLARRWEKRGVIQFRSVAYDLFRFGVRVYARYQPQFLHEFIADNLDPGQSSAAYVGSAEMQAAAREALSLTTIRTRPKP
jgi:tetratricopeptide (TPR) repeat protein